VFKDK